MTDEIFFNLVYLCGIFVVLGGGFYWGACLFGIE